MKTATVAANTAAPTAISAISHPAMLPVRTVWTTVGCAWDTAEGVSVGDVALPLAYEGKPTIKANAEGAKRAKPNKLLQIATTTLAVRRTKWMWCMTASLAMWNESVWKYEPRPEARYTTFYGYPCAGPWRKISLPRRKVTAMISRLSASEQDLRALAGVVSEIRSDLPADGLPLSLLSDLKDQIPCDFLLCHGYDTTLQQYWFTQQIPEDDGDGDPGDEDLFRVFWEQYWDCQVCSYPDRTGDLRSIVKVHDFYSVRQWHSTVCTPKS
jgi:hypothetical protein